MGSSIGISITSSEREFEKAVEYIRKNYPSQEIIAQEYLEGAVEESNAVAFKRKTENSLYFPQLRLFPKKMCFLIMTLSILLVVLRK